MQLENAIVFGSLAIATVLVIAAAARVPNLRLNKRMGPPNWDFSKSWASSFTVLGAVLGTIIATKGVLPEKTAALTLGGYAGLGLAFGLIIVVAPFLYRALSSPGTGKTPEPQYEGRVWSFLLCTLLGVWAVLGQLATVFYLFGEMRGVALSNEVIVALQALFAVSAVMLLIYMGRAIKWTIEAQAEAESANKPLPPWNMP